MKKSTLFWALSFIITASTAYYQRVTGPTYPLSGSIVISNQTLAYKFERSHSASEDAEVKVPVLKQNFKGKLVWKRYKTNDVWTEDIMNNSGYFLISSLPKQPPAGKLEYYVLLSNAIDEIRLPSDQNVIIRYKGDVPAWILIPHIIAMFGTMLLSTRTGLEFFNKGTNIKALTFWTVGFLLVGGMILGPLTQLYAFNALWTGYPFGSDLTDNKTLIALIGWLITIIALYKSKNPKVWVLFSSVLLLAVFLIPHSMFGSELDYNSLDKAKRDLKIESIRIKP